MNTTPELDLDDIEESDVKSLRQALLVYRFFAYTTGILLVLLVCVGVPMKYFGHNDAMVTYTGLPHGWLYMGLLISAWFVGHKAGWSWGRLAAIALAGTVPFLSFVAEASARKDVRAKILAMEQALERQIP